MQLFLRVSLTFFSLALPLLLLLNIYKFVYFRFINDVDGATCTLKKHNTCNYTPKKCNHRIKREREKDKIYVWLSFGRAHD